MLLTQVHCPRCHAALKSNQPIPTGKRAQCPKCKAAFTAGEAAPPAHSGLRFALIAGGAVLLIACGVVLALICFSGDGATPQAVAQGNEPGGGTPILPGSQQPKSGEEFKPVEAPPAGNGPKAKDPGPFKEVEDPPPGVPVKPVKGGPQPAAGVLPPDVQKKVNDAIDRGVDFLRKGQEKNGTWSNQTEPVGYAALPGLTLLECGATADEEAVKRAAHFVRFHSAELKKTYHLATAILFLDRLGEAKDKHLIRSMALRLMAGQNHEGGWSYNCPILTPSEEQALLTFLRTNRPKRLHESIAGGGPLPEAVGNDSGRKDPGDRPDNGRDPKVSNPEEKRPTPPKVKPEPKQKPLRVEELPPRLRELPVVQDNPTAKKPAPPPKGQKPPKGEKGEKPFPRAQRADNSNTQFAIMALWAARRHDLPTERTVAMVDKRFRTSQKEDGSWDYTPGSNPGRPLPTMTCVGLLGLAMGHGIDRELMSLEAGGGLKPAASKDEAIQKGLKKVGAHIPDHATVVGVKNFNAYYLWSVERVGVLYNLKTIGNRDWYRWGVAVLLPTQDGDGAWHGRVGPGSSKVVDTCFALLFLKRANLTQDLTEHLRLHIAITDPDAHK